MPLNEVKSLVGTVLSNQMMKTVVVGVQMEKRHPLYKKLRRHTKKYQAHDEENRCKVGDKVRIVEGRPLSREKRWRVVEVLSQPQGSGRGQ